jgi:hypothetical protein
LRDYLVTLGRNGTAPAPAVAATVKARPVKQ